MNLNHYSSSKKEIVGLVFMQSDKDLLRNISLIATCTHVPVIACMFFVGEALNWPQNILDNIEKLKISYSYTNIEGIPESYPGRKI